MAGASAEQTIRPRSFAEALRKGENRSLTEIKTPLIVTSTRVLVRAELTIELGPPSHVTFFPLCTSREPAVNGAVHVKIDTAL